MRAACVMKPRSADAQLQKNVNEFSVFISMIFTGHCPWSWDNRGRERCPQVT